MTRFFNILLVVVVLLVVAARQGKLVGFDFPAKESNTQAEVNTNSSVDIELVKEFFPEAAACRAIDTTCVGVFSASNKHLGSILYSSPYSDKIVGYVGPTPLLIAIDSEEKIVGVKMLDNDETPGYVRRVEKKGYMDSWNGLSVSDALRLEVDHVSGATFTSTAVEKSLHARLAVINPDNLSGGKIQWLTIGKQLALLLVLLLALYSFFKPAKAKKVRVPLLILSVGILGFWQGSMLSLAQFYAALTSGMSLAGQWTLILILICAIALPLFTGKKFYCVYLCPFGAAQELAGKLNKKKIQLGQAAIKWLLVFRKAILLTIILLLILAVGIDAATLGDIEPFSAFNPGSASILALVIAGVSLVLSIFISKPWCRFLCPTGQVLDTMQLKKSKNTTK